MKTTAPRKKSKPSARAPKGKSRKAAQGALRIVFTERQIRRRVAELAAEINRAYEGKRLQIVCIPDDCFLFIADLVRALRIEVVCHFVTTRMRDAAVGAVPVREIQYLGRLDLAGKHVLLVSGIVYSGVTLNFLYRQISSQGPRSLRTASLVEKPEDRKVDVATDYLAFKSTHTEGEFLVGYGLAHQGLYRNLPCIAALAT